MLSRTASSIYWMNRYLERADNVVSIAGQDFFVDATITVTGSGRPIRRRS